MQKFENYFLDSLLTCVCIFCQPMMTEDTHSNSFSMLFFDNCYVKFSVILSVCQLSKELGVKIRSFWREIMKLAGIGNKFWSISFILTIFSIKHSYLFFYKGWIFGLGAVNGQSACNSVPAPCGKFETCQACFEK